ncbi:MAG: CYTH domain-containing protein [Bacteroidota bacterium]|nr:CYTH domain-containing protein [Bacteroidota bacterium]
MSTEIERKFLVRNLSWKENQEGVFIAQGYLNATPDRTVRVRIAGEQAWITIKGRTTGISRLEFEYPIPLSDAQQLLLLCEGNTIEKIRYRIPAGQNLIWEVDEFLGANKGLIIAEIELNAEGQVFTRPGWLGEEVSRDRRYYNSYLSQNPYSVW